MEKQPGEIKLVHITTVPETLHLLKGQVAYMKARGFAPHAISSPGPWLTRFETEEHVPTCAVPMQRRITLRHDLVALVRLWRDLRRLRPQIVHAHTPKAGLLGMIAAWLARTPVRVYHMRGLPFMSAAGAKRRILINTERLSCFLAHRVVCNSTSNWSVAIEQHLCPAHKITILHKGSSNGVDAVTRFNPACIDRRTWDEMRSRCQIPPDALVLGFVGRIVRDKGLIELTQAWRLLRDEFPTLHLLVIGRFEPQDPIPPDAEALLHSDERIHLTGSVDPALMPSMYAIMDLFTLPTYREGFPNVLLEAAAMGLPVVATRAAGCVDAVAEGQTGLLVEPYDGAALAEALRQYVTCPELRRQHGQAGRERVLADFQPEAIWGALYEEYCALLRARRIALPAPGEPPLMNLRGPVRDRRS